MFQKHCGQKQNEMGLAKLLQLNGPGVYTLVYHPDRARHRVSGEKIRCPKNKRQRI